MTKATSVPKVTPKPKVILEPCEFSVTYTCMSCGVHMVYGLEDAQDHPERIIKELIYPKVNQVGVGQSGGSAARSSSCALYIFSDAKRYGNGRALEEYIKKHSLGAISKFEETERVTNPNSGNQIEVWTYQPDRTAMAAHIKTLEAALNV